jgi:hypothetical protein
MADLAEDHITLARIHEGQLLVTRGDDTTHSYPLTDLLPNEVNPGEVIIGNYDGSLWIGINYFAISPIRHGFVFLNLSRTGDMIKNQLDFNDGTTLKDVQEYQGQLLLLQDREPVYSFSDFLPDPIRISVLDATEWHVQRLEDFGLSRVIPKRLLIGEDGVVTVAGTQENNYLPLEIRTTDRVYFAQRDVSLLTSSGSIIVSDNHPLLYPNPARSTVLISTAVELCMIYDSFGRLIHTGKPLGRINISTFPSGSYIIKMRTSSGKFRTERLIVK